MNDDAYDISHLLESDWVKIDVPERQMAKAPPAAPRQSAVAAAQEAMAQELLMVAEVHEELIKQYLRISDGASEDPFWQ
jgi:hypothetical protein